MPLMVKKAVMVKTLPIMTIACCQEVAAMAATEVVVPAQASVPEEATAAVAEAVLLH